MPAACLDRLLTLQEEMAGEEERMRLLKEAEEATKRAKAEVERKEN